MPVLGIARDLAAAGLGTITKGVGVIALLILIPAAVASLRGWAGVRIHARDARFWLGPLAFVAACGVWLVPMLIAALRRYVVTTVPNCWRSCWRWRPTILLWKSAKPPSRDWMTGTLCLI